MAAERTAATAGNAAKRQGDRRGQAELP